MPSFNQVILIGNLAADPELRNTDNGVSKSRFRMATNESWKNKNTGEWESSTDWHDVVAWGPLAERLQGKIFKGNLVMVVGRLKTHTYEKDGVTKRITEVKADKVQNHTRVDKPIYDEESGPEV